MDEFNRMTVVAAAEVVADFSSHADMKLCEVQWDINGKCSTSSKSARAASWAEHAISNDLDVYTENGCVSLARAIIETAIKSPKKDTDAWRKLVAGLRFDGFEIVNVEAGESYTPFFGEPEPITSPELKRMLPESVPDLNFREAESEVEALLDQCGFTVARGHLNQAVSAFQRGEWSGANGELRNFFESYFNEIAIALGCADNVDSKAKRDFLGKLTPPFLLSDYNEWHENNQKPQYVQGLMNRMHPHGGHPGLSEEEDATFRLHVSLVTARLFLRRYSKRRQA